jgi:hypothetical protein
MLLLCADWSCGIVEVGEELGLVVLGLVALGCCC